MSIKSRIKAAKRQVETTKKFWQRDNYKKVFSCTSITNGTPYQMILTANKEKQYIEDVPFYTIDCQCFKVNLTEDCKSNNKTICHHVMAALIKSNEDRGRIVTFFDNFSKAVIYSNLGGSLVKVQSIGGYGWMVVKVKRLVDIITDYVAFDPNYTKSNLVSEKDYPSLDAHFEQAGFDSVAFENHINLMRGPVEESIE